MLLPQPGAAAHFKAGWQDNPTAAEGLASEFLRLRQALAARVAAKRAYIIERGVAPLHALDPACLGIVNPEGRDAFYRRAPTPGAARVAMPAFDISYKLR